MKSLESSEEKLQKICDVLRRETLEPAKMEGQRIIAEANDRAEQIIQEAQRRSEEIISQTQRNIEQEQRIFKSSLEQATKQSLESLRQSIEQKLFNQELYDQIMKATSDPNIVSNLISSLINAIDQEGQTVEISAFIPKTVSAKEINQLLGQAILNKLKEKSVVVGDFSGGARVKLANKHVTLDITDKDIAELLSRYVRKDFRNLIFASV
jgi:V/A-type H+/Na+-transporting ATPase subunit E